MYVISELTILPALSLKEKYFSFSLLSFLQCAVWEKQGDIGGQTDFVDYRWIFNEDFIDAPESLICHI
jgi:hypothetical protein